MYINLNLKILHLYWQAQYEIVRRGRTTVERNNYLFTRNRQGI